MAPTSASGGTPAPDVYITGIGVVLPNCFDRHTFWRQLRDGESQLRFERDPSDPDGVLPMGRVRNFDGHRFLREIPVRFWQHYSSELQMYLASVLLARDDAGLDLAGERKTRIGLFDGCARPAFQFWHEKLSDPQAGYGRRDLAIGLAGQSVGLAASLLEIQGPTYAFTGTCSSGAIAIGHALKEIRAGEVDIAFAGGHESTLIAPLFAMYRDANLLSLEKEDPARAIRPYVDYSTNAFGEGAVTLVLESRAHAEQRHATPIAALAGYRHGNNGYHPTTVDILGVRPTEVIQELFERCQVGPDQVGFVVGHGNAVELSDVSEERYMRRVFKERATEVPLISTKPIWGHTLGASSAINTAAAALMLRHDFVVPTINVDEKRQRPGTNHQANHGVARALTHGLAVSYGMGGHNAALLLTKAGGR